MNILNNMKKIPGGIMLVPMFIVAIINTFAPNALNIGSATTALFKTGTMTIIGIILFTAGTQLKLKNLPQALARGGTFLLIRIILCVATCAILKPILGTDKTLMGISLLAFVIVMSSCNPGVYAAICSQFGDPIDMAAMGVINIIAVPQFALLVLAIFFAEGSNVNPWIIAIGTIIPFIIGLILANVDENFQKMFAPVTPVSLFFLGICFGSSLNLITAVKSGIQGILLGIIFLVISLVICLPVDKFILKRPGYAAVSFCCVGGVAIGTPAVVAAAIPAFEPFVPAAAGQCAFAVILCAIVVPILARKFTGKTEG